MLSCRYGAIYTLDSSFLAKEVERQLAQCNCCSEVSRSCWSLWIHLWGWQTNPWFRWGDLLYLFACTVRCPTRPTQLGLASTCEMYSDIFDKLHSMQLFFKTKNALVGRATSQLSLDWSSDKRSSTHGTVLSADATSSAQINSLGMKKLVNAVCVSFTLMQVSYNVPPTR